METLIRLVQSLKPKETQLIKDYYQIGGAKRSQEQKRLQLFKLILSEQVRSDQEAYRALYKDQSSSALCQLKKRLQQDILNIILINSSMGSYSLTSRKEMNCYKSFLMGKVLIERGLFDEGVHLLEKTSAQAQKCELLSIQLSCDDALRSLQTYTHVQYSSKIKRCLDNFSDLLQAKESYFTAARMASVPHEPCPPVDQRKLLEKKRGDCHSKKAAFWYTMALICYYKQEGKFELAKSAALQFISDATGHLSVITEQEKATFYLQLAQILIGLYEPEEAVRPAQQAVQLAYDNHLQEQALETLFQAHFQSRHWEQAEEVLQQADQEKLPDDEVSAGVWFFLRSCLLFIQRKYKESTRCLLTHENTMDDKSDLIVWAKFLELINILEVEDFDWFEFKLESLRKRLRRFDCQGRRRIKTLFQLFNGIKRNNYDYRSTNSYEQATVTLLSDPHSLSAWDPLSYELINTSAWFIGKVYQPPL